MPGAVDSPGGRGAARVGWGRTLLRGLTRRCGRCGGGGVFEGYFRLREQCPRCGVRFAREEGFFTGVYLINFSVTLGLMFVALMVFVLQRAISGSTGPLWPILTVCAAFAVLGPVLLYPIAATTWAALDLASRPLEPYEEAEAALWVAGDERTDPGDGRRRPRQAGRGRRSG